jgi:hypothetical protein
MRLKLLLPVAIVLGLFAVQPVLSNAAHAQTSTTTTVKKPVAKKKAAKKAAKKPAAKKAAAKKAMTKTS